MWLEHLASAFKYEFCGLNPQPLAFWVAAVDFRPAKRYSKREAFNEELFFVRRRSVLRKFYMSLLFRLILIAWLALPQGWCCVAKGYEKSSDSNCAETNSAGNSCRCCRIKPETALSESGIPRPDKSPPLKSCECKCRFQIAAPKSQTICDIFSIIGNYRSHRAEANAHRESLGVTSVDRNPFIRFQILYCIWRC